MKNRTFIRLIKVPRSKLRGILQRSSTAKHVLREELLARATSCVVALLSPSRRNVGTGYFRAAITYTIIITLLFQNIALASYSNNPKNLSSSSLFKSTDKQSQMQASLICETIEKRARYGKLLERIYLDDILSWSKSSEEEFKGCRFETMPYEIRIHLPFDNVIVRYFNPQKADPNIRDVITTKKISSKLCRQVIHGGKALLDKPIKEPNIVKAVPERGFILLESLIAITALFVAMFTFIFSFAVTLMLTDDTTLSFTKDIIKLLPTLSSFLGGFGISWWVLKQIEYGVALWKKEPAYDLLSRVVPPLKEPPKKSIKFTEYNYKVITGQPIEAVTLGISLSDSERGSLAELSSIEDDSYKYILYYGAEEKAGTKKKYINKLAGIITVRERGRGIISVDVEWAQHDGKRQLSEDFVITELANLNPVGIIFLSSDIDAEIIDRLLPNHTIADKKETAKRLKGKVFSRLGIGDDRRYTFFAMDKQDFKERRHFYFGSFKFSSLWKMAEIDHWIYAFANGLFFALVFSSIFAHAEAIRVLAKYTFFEEYVNLILTVIVAPLAARSIAKVIRLRWDPVRSRYGRRGSDDMWLSVTQNMRMGWRMIGTFKIIAYTRIFLSVLSLLLIPAIGVIAFGISSAYIYLGLLFLKLIMDHIISAYEQRYYKEIAETAILFNEAAKREGYAENFHNIDSTSEVFRELIYACGLLIGYGIFSSSVLHIASMPLAILAIIAISISSFLVPVKGRDYKNYLKIWGRGFTLKSAGKVLLSDGITLLADPINPLVVHPRPVPVTGDFSILPWVEQLGVVIECTPGNKPNIKFKNPKLQFGGLRTKKGRCIIEWPDKKLKIELVSREKTVDIRDVAVEYKQNGGCIIRFYPKKSADKGPNVSCGTICESGHEGSYNALDSQLARQFEELKKILDIKEEKNLTEEEADRALVAYAEKFGIKVAFEQLQGYRRKIKETDEALKQINIFFSIPETGTSLFWVGDDYAGGHFNRKGTRIHISLPVILRRGIQAGIGIAGHELAHIKGRVHEEDTGLQTVKEIAQGGDKELEFLPEIHYGMTTVQKVRYKGKVYWAKYVDNSLSELRFVIPQIEIMRYLNGLGIPGICRVKHFLEPKGGRKIILFEEFPSGSTLVNKRGCTTVYETVDIILKILNIVKDLHKAGVYHWDINPENIWLTDSGEVILFDFDLAFRTEDEFWRRTLFKAYTQGYESANRYKWSIEGRYDKRDEIFPPISSEIYSLAMTLDYMLPEAAPQELEDIIDKSGRCEYKTVEEFIKDLERFKLASIRSDTSKIITASPGLYTLKEEAAKYVEEIVSKNTSSIAVNPKTGERRYFSQGNPFIPINAHVYVMEGQSWDLSPGVEFPEYMNGVINTEEGALLLTAGPFYVVENAAHSHRFIRPLTDSEVYERFKLRRVHDRDGKPFEIPVLGIGGRSILLPMQYKMNNRHVFGLEFKKAGTPAYRKHNINSDFPPTIFSEHVGKPGIFLDWWHQVAIQLPVGLGIKDIYSIPRESLLLGKNADLSRWTIAVSELKDPYGVTLRTPVGEYRRLSIFFNERGIARVDVFDSIVGELELTVEEYLLKLAKNYGKSFRNIIETGLIQAEHGSIINTDILGYCTDFEDFSEIKEYDEDSLRSAVNDWINNLVKVLSIKGPEYKDTANRALREFAVNFIGNSENISNLNIDVDDITELSKFIFEHVRGILHKDKLIQHAVAERFLDMVKSAQTKEAGRKTILALDTDIGNMTQFGIDELLKQIRDVSSLLGDIEFVAGPGETLTRLIDDAKAKLKTDDLDVIVVTKKEKDDFDKTYNIVRVDDGRLEDLGNYVPILELLTFALVLSYSDNNALLGQVYAEITGTELTDELKEQIKNGIFAIPLPPTERISSDFYNTSVEILKSA